MPAQALGQLVGLELLFLELSRSDGHSDF
jgi:hypothetical protein